jgi:hypothetical protein
MKNYVHFWPRIPPATLVVMVTLVIIVSLGIPSHPDNSDVTGTIRKCQKSVSGERYRNVTQRVYFTASK